MEGGVRKTSEGRKRLSGFPEGFQPEVSRHLRCFFFFVCEPLYSCQRVYPPTSGMNATSLTR